MAQLYMLKHRGFPGRMPSSDAQFTIRRPATKGVTPLVPRERYRDRRAVDRKADELFGSISAMSRLNAGILMQGGSTGCSTARSLLAKTRLIMRTTRRCCSWILT